MICFEDAAGETDHPDSGSHYLHPSLLSTNSQHGVGSNQVKTLQKQFNRDSFLVVIVINVLCFKKIWMPNGLNKLFIKIIDLVIFSNCLEQLMIHFFSICRCLYWCAKFKVLQLNTSPHFQSVEQKMDYINIK